MQRCIEKCACTKKKKEEKEKEREEEEEEVMVACLGRRRGGEREGPNRR